MRINRTYFRKGTAAILLLLFAFLHVAKAAHHHNNCSHPDASHSPAISKASLSCDICDFQLAKDAGLPSPITIENSSTPIVRVYAGITATTIAARPAFITGRGPPSFI